MFRELRNWFFLTTVLILSAALGTGTHSQLAWQIYDVRETLDIDQH